MKNRTLDLIYSSAGNEKFSEIAARNNWRLGAQMPKTVYARPYFADQNYKNPQITRYAASVEAWSPTLATVTDWERYEQMEDIFDMAESIAPHVETIIIIPKIVGTVELIPPIIGGRKIRLGYSVETRHGKTPVKPHEFGDRDVHLLGGSPHTQMALYGQMNVVSADTNYHQRMAVKYGAVWCNGTAIAKNRYFPTLRELGIQVDWDRPSVAFSMSCKAIMSAWNRMGVIVNGDSR
jgi:hypothetical protein